MNTALLALANATDGAGRRIILYSPPLGKTHDVDSLRRTLVAFGRINEGFIPQFVSFSQDPLSQLQAEIAYWRNLALLANATAEAIDNDMRGNGV